MGAEMPFSYSHGEGWNGMVRRGKDGLGKAK